jgi:hypothetical protein
VRQFDDRMDRDETLALDAHLVDARTERRERERAVRAERRLPLRRAERPPAARALGAAEERHVDRTVAGRVDPTGENERALDDEVVADRRVAQALGGDEQIGLAGSVHLACDADVEEAVAEHRRRVVAVRVGHGVNPPMTALSAPRLELPGDGDVRDGRTVRVVDEAGGGDGVAVGGPGGGAEGEEDRGGREAGGWCHGRRASSSMERKWVGFALKPRRSYSGSTASK